MKTLTKSKTSRAKAVKPKQPVAAPKDSYILRLFVAGATPRSQQAILRVRTMCETMLKDRVKLEVIDIYQQPAKARENQIVATPTLIIVFPPPVRRFIGNLTTIMDLFVEMDVGSSRTLSP